MTVLLKEDLLLHKQQAMTIKKIMRMRTITVMANKSMKFSLLFKRSERLQELSSGVVLSTVVWLRTVPEIMLAVLF